MGQPRGGGACGARGPPQRSQAASRLLILIRNSSSLNSGVPAPLPRPTHRFLSGSPQQGGRHGWAGPQAQSQPSQGGSCPSCPPPPARSGQKELSGESWLGALPPCHIPLAWPSLASLPAAAAAIQGLDGDKGAGGDKAEQA